jgi:hypothetical protein
MFTAMLFQHCSTTSKTAEPTVYNFETTGSGENDMKVLFKSGKAFNHPTYVLWLEDMEGNYLRTLFITRSYASGIFGHQMVGDSVWLKTSGASYQPAALPYWTHKKGVLKNGQLVPTPDNQFTDAYTGATPLGDLTFSTSIKHNPPYRILCEVNQTWDWDKYWTNNKYPDSPEYKHSAQPSLIFAVTVRDKGQVYHLNPIGHGDPKGESGNLFTNISTLSTAKDIFESISVKLEKNR